MTERAPFPLAVHYYRQPTPRPGEWDADLAHIRELGVNTVQFRPHWSWHERVEGRYQWEDLDRLFDLAEGHGLDVVFKFMLESAPAWLYRNYPATRVRPDGSPIPPVATGAVYPGGWMPCFDAPEVRERAARFVRAGVERYRERPSLTWWHAWNEPRSRPVGECACPASRASYRAYLKERFGTVEQLNDFLGKCWGGFEDVAPPAGFMDYAEVFLWRQWAARSVAGRVRLVADAIRAADPHHPVMAHVGCCGPIQNPLGDTSDDLLTAGVVDMYGTSLAPGLDGTMGPEADALNLDWIRAVNRGRAWWVNEAYSDPCLGFRCEKGPAHVRHVFLTPIARGAGGVMAWQYRAERLGTESMDDGMVDAAGEDTPRSLELGRIGAFLAEHGGLFVGSRVPQAEIALVYDFRADLLSAIEDVCFAGCDLPPLPGAGHPYSLAEGYAYKRALQGAYAMFFNAGLPVEMVDSRRAESLCEGFKLAYLPLPFFVGEELAGHLLRFVKSGGLLVAEAGLGLRAENTWLEVRPPGPALAELGYRLKRHFRVRGACPGATLEVFAHGAVPALSYLDVLEPLAGSAARPAGKWLSAPPGGFPEGAPPALECPLGAGRALVLAFSPGLSGREPACAALAAALAGAAGVSRPVEPRGRNAESVIARTLETSDGRRALFLRNGGGNEARLEAGALSGEDIWGGSRREGGELVIPAGEFAVLLSENS